MIQIGKLKKTVIAKPKRLNAKLDNQFVNDTRIINNKPQTQELQAPNTIREVIENLDRDVVDKGSNLTTIDFNTRLHASEMGGIVALQMLHTLGVGGSAVSLIARSIKRHKVSLNGLGREEKVRIIQGEREHETDGNDTSLFGKLKGFMGSKENAEK